MGKPYFIYKKIKGTEIANEAGKYINVLILVTLCHSFIYFYLTYCFQKCGE